MKNEFMEPKPDSQREKALVLEEYVMAIDILAEVQKYKIDHGTEPEGMTESRAGERLAEAKNKCTNLGITEDEINEYVQHRRERVGGIE